MGKMNWKTWEDFVYRNKEGAFGGLLVGFIIYSTKIFPYQWFLSLAMMLNRTDEIFLANAIILGSAAIGTLLDMLIMPRK